MGADGSVEGASEGAPEGAPDVRADSGGTTPEAAIDAALDAGADAAPIEASSDAAVDAGSVYAATVLADTPLAYWRLGDSNTSGSCHDATGNGNDALVVGGVTLGVPGALMGDPDTAAHFDGTTGVLQVGNKFNFTGMVPMTIELWANPDVIDGTYRHLESKMLYNDAGQPYDGIYMYVHQATTMGWERWGDGTIDLAPTTPVVTTGAWWHIVGTFDGATETLYVNANPVQEGQTQVAVAANTVSMLLGDLFQGSLDEVAIYGTALSATRVLAHYEASGR